MAFNVLGFVLASALTQDLEDRERASQLTLLGGVLGTNPIGLVLVASAAQQEADGDGTGLVVPDVRGKSQQEADVLITEAGFVPVIEKADAAGQVHSQRPVGGSLLSAGADVELFVIDAVAVPDVTGKGQREAEGLITKAGFVPVVEKATQPGTKGQVQSQRPAGGSLLGIGAEVVLFVVDAVIANASATTAGGSRELAAPAERT